MDGGEGHGLPFTREEVRAFVRAQLEAVDELTKEREAARAVDQTLAPGESPPRYVVRRASWIHRFTYGPGLYVAALVLHLVSTGALIAIALRLYGVR